MPFAVHASRLGGIPDIVIRRWKLNSFQDHTALIHSPSIVVVDDVDAFFLMNNHCLIFGGNGDHVFSPEWYPVVMRG